MSDEPRIVKVTLAAEHTHRGIVYPAGTEITLRTDQAARLYRAGKLARKPDIPELKAS